MKSEKDTLFIEKTSIKESISKNETSVDLLILEEFLEAHYGKYLAQIFTNEWKVEQATKSIIKWEDEHGKALALLFENESQKVLLTELNDKLKRAAEIYQKDLKMAAAVQQSLLHKEPPVTNNYDIAFCYIPMSSVSGDFYDFYVNENNDLTGLVIADVSGHGIASGLLTTLAKPIMYKMVRDNPDMPLGNIMNLIHNELVKEIEESSYYFTTIILKFLDHTVEYVNAAHPEMLIKSKNDCHFLRKNDESITGPMIGLKAVTYEYDSITFNIEKDDFLIIFTDCIIESKNKENEELGIEKLQEVVSNSTANTAQDLLSELLQVHLDHVGDMNVKDDLTIIIIKRK